MPIKKCLKKYKSMLFKLLCYLCLTVYTIHFFSVCKQCLDILSEMRHHTETAVQTLDTINNITEYIINQDYAIQTALINKDPPLIKDNNGNASMIIVDILALDSGDREHIVKLKANFELHSTVCQEIQKLLYSEKWLEAQIAFQSADYQNSYTNVQDSVDQCIQDAINKAKETKKITATLTTICKKKLITAIIMFIGSFFIVLALIRNYAKKHLIT